MQNDEEIIGQNLQPSCLAMAFPNKMSYLEQDILLRIE